MARLARMIIPGVPHHVTQRGNRRERIFFEAGDEAVYLDLLSSQLRRCAVECWAYCLMPNHVHLILTPSDESGLARAVNYGDRLSNVEIDPIPPSGERIAVKRLRLTLAFIFGTKDEQTTRIHEMFWLRKSTPPCPPYHLPPNPT